MRRVERLLLMTAVLAATATARAGDVSSTLANCRAEENENARLACYDRLADDVSTPRAKAPSSPATPESGAASSATAHDTDNRPESTAPPPPEAGSSPREDFGYRGGPLARAETAAREEAERKQDSREVEQVSGTVTEVSRRGRGVLVVTLDNGQTWMQKAPDARFIVESGDAVRIEAATLGSYMMYRADSKRGTRVTRVR